MSKLISSIKELEERILTECQANKGQIAHDIRSFADNLNSFRIPPSYCDLSSTDNLYVTDERVMPHHLRIGYKEVNLDDGTQPFRIPLTLDLQEANAVMFELDDKNSASPLQQIGFRLLMSLKPGLCHLHLVDANFGASFAQLGQIRHPQLRIENVNSLTGVEQLIQKLASIIVEANHTYRANFANLNAYNSREENNPQPYHIVLIDDFPENFNDTTIVELQRIISRGNAVNAGIYIFINHRKETDLSSSRYGMRQLNPDAIREVCTCVSLNQAKRITINQEVLSASKTELDIETRIGSHVQQLFNDINVANRVNTKLLDQWIEDLKQSGNVWKASTITGINVPVGIIGENRKFSFYMGDDTSDGCSDYFALILGQTGTGKTVFQHTIITQLSMYYSPEELELYLLDFKNGTGFDCYKKLPHAKAVMSANNIEFARRVLLELTEEAERRARLFREAADEYKHQINNVGEYRRLTKKPMPRIVLLMDEFQVLFGRDNLDDIVSDARKLLIGGIRQWRAYGIIIILSTQTMAGVNIGEADGQISYRFAFTVGADDSRYLIGNDGASRLGKEKGRCIMHNSPDRSEALNVEFRNVWTDNYAEHIEFLTNKYLKECSSTLPLRYICNNQDVDIMENNAVAELTENPHRCYTYLGKPDILRFTHTRICYKRQANSNTLLIGDNTPTAINLIALSLMQAKKQSARGSRFYVVDCTSPGNQYENSFEKLPSLSNDFVVGSLDILDILKQELERRKTERTEGGYSEQRIFVAIFNTQSAYELRPQRGAFAPKRSPQAEMLCDLIKDGPALGLHCILHSLSAAEIFDRSGMIGEAMWPYFENKVLFNGADTPFMAKLELKLRKFGTISPDFLVVDNHKLDEEEYEICKTYTKINKAEFKIENLNQI